MLFYLFIFKNEKKRNEGEEDRGRKRGREDCGFILKMGIENFFYVNNCA